MLCRLMSLLVHEYGLYPAFEKAGISHDFVLKKRQRASSILCYALAPRIWRKGIITGRSERLLTAASTR